MRQGVTVVDPATTWIDTDVSLGPRRRRSTRSTQLHGATTDRRRRRPSGRTRPWPTSRSATAPPWCAPTARTRSSAPAPRSGRSPTCGRAPSSAPRARSAPSSRPRTPTIGAGSKVPHLSYVGDATIGEAVQHRRGQRVRQLRRGHQVTAPRSAATAAPGRDNMFVAPVTVGDGAYTGAGTVVRKDVPPGALAINVAPQRNLEGWVQDKRAGTAAADGRQAAARPLPHLLVPRRRAGPHRRDDRIMTGLKLTPEKNLMVFSGRAHPQLAEEVAYQLGTELVPTTAYDFANGEIYVRYEESVRGSRRVRHPEPHRADQRVDHGAPDHGRRAQARLGQADHGGPAVLRLRPPGQEAPRPRADLGPADGRPVQDGRRRPADGGRPAHRADPGLLRRPGGPPDGAADPHRATWSRSTAGETLAVVSPDAGRIKVAEQWSSRLGGAPLAFIHKTRDITRPNESVANRVVGEVKGRLCILVDDMIDTGGTITQRGRRADGGRRRRRGHRGHPRDPVRARPSTG